MDHLLEWEEFNLNEGTKQEIGKHGKYSFNKIEGGYENEFSIINTETNEMVGEIRLGDDFMKKNYLMIETIYILKDEDKRQGIYTAFLEIVGKYLKKKQSILGFASEPYVNDEKRSKEANLFWKGMLKKLPNQVTVEKDGKDIYYYYTIK